jgi:hypothetical protein
VTRTRSRVVVDRGVPVVGITLRHWHAFAKGTIQALGLALAWPGPDSLQYTYYHATRRRDNYGPAHLDWFWVRH